MQIPMLCTASTYSYAAQLTNYTNVDIPIDTLTQRVNCLTCQLGITTAVGLQLSFDLPSS